MKPPDENKTPAEARYLGGGNSVEDGSPDNSRSVRRQYLSKRLHAAGPRPMLEAFLEVAGGADLDHTLEHYARIPSSVYRIVGASSFSRILRIIKRSSK